METVEIIDPRTLATVKSEEETAHNLLLVIEARYISTPQEYEEGVHFLVELKNQLDQIEAKEKEITKPARESLNRVYDLFRPLKELRKKAIKLWDFKLSQYRKKDEQKRQDEEHHARLEAQKEQDRLRAQADRKAEKLEAQGKEERAELVRSSVPVLPLPIIASDVPQVKGVTVRKNWKYRILYPEKIAPGFLMPDETKIGKAVRAIGKLAEQTVGGIEVYEEEIMARTGRP